MKLSNVLGFIPLFLVMLVAFADSGFIEHYLAGIGAIAWGWFWFWCVSSTSASSKGFAVGVGVLQSVCAFGLYMA